MIDTLLARAEFGSKNPEAGVSTFSVDDSILDLSECKGKVSPGIKRGIPILEPKGFSAAAAALNKCDFEGLPSWLPTVADLSE